MEIFEWRLQLMISVAAETALLPLAAHLLPLATAICIGGTVMPQTEAQARSCKKYHDQFDDIKLRVPKGERAVLHAHAASQGESLNNFLYRAVKETIARDNAKSDG